MILQFDGMKPVIDESVFVAENATVIGDVKIGEGSSVWFGAVVRGDMESIIIGSRTNIQDLSVLHVAEDTKLFIGNGVTVGHKAVVHGCSVGNNCLIGMGSIIMDGAEIGENCIIGAGSLLTQGTKIPAGSLVFGSPAKVKRELTEEEIRKISESAEEYFRYSRKYLK